ncbi:alpha/beta fold hydrolase [Polymorphobacter sp.]|uniref:alpha/beta fold hydrolase n=1 Tax=Polymorphobacter sp. TaxID=1909290 RepID=UPI003F71F71D
MGGTARLVGGLRVIEAGSGPPLVLLHGGGSGAEVFRSLIDRLADQAQCIAPDLRGFGGSRGQDIAPDHAQWALDVVALLDALGIGRAALLGWSMGAVVAINAASRWPGRVSRLFLLGAPDPARQPDLAGMLAANDCWLGLDDEARVLADREAVMAGLGEPARDDAGLVDELVAARAATPAEARCDLLRAMAVGRPDLRQALPAITCPVHLLVGDRDTISPELSARAIAALVSGASVDILPGCGHYPANEKPEAVASIIQRYLGGSERA